MHGCATMNSSMLSIHYLWFKKYTQHYTVYTISVYYQTKLGRHAESEKVYPLLSKWQNPLVLRLPEEKKTPMAEAFSTAARRKKNVSCQGAFSSSTCFV